MRVIDWSLILLHTSWDIYLISKNSKYKVIFLSKNNKTQCVTLLFLWFRFIICDPSFILRKLFLEKTPLNTGSFLKQLVISILLKGWRGTKNFYPYILFLLLYLLFHLYLLLLKKSLIALMKRLKILTKLQESCLLFFFFMYYRFSSSIN